MLIRTRDTLELLDRPKFFLKSLKHTQLHKYVQYEQNGVGMRLI